MSHSRILEAIRILQALGLAKEHHNARDGLALLALLRVGPAQTWSDAINPVLHAASVAAFAGAYDIRPRKDAAAFMHSTTLPAFVAAGIVALNPDAPGRPAKSPHNLYQVPYPVFKRLVALGARQAYRTRRTAL